MFWIRAIFLMALYFWIKDESVWCLAGVMLGFFIAVTESEHREVKRGVSVGAFGWLCEFVLRFSLGFSAMRGLESLYRFQHLYPKLEAVGGIYFIFGCMILLTWVVTRQNGFWIYLPFRQMQRRAKQRAIQAKENHEKQYRRNLDRVCRQFGFESRHFREPFMFRENLRYRLTEDMQWQSEEEQVVAFHNEARYAHYQSLIQHWYEKTQAFPLELEAMDHFGKQPTLKTFNHWFDQVEQYLHQVQLPKSAMLDGNGHLQVEGIQQLTKDVLHYVKRRRQSLMPDYFGIRRGIEGEDAVNQELLPHMDIINLPNIRLELGDVSIENDNILLTRRGIFTLEVKNFGTSGKFSIVIEADGRWLRRYEDGRVEVMKNVTSQQMRHIGYLNQWVNQTLNRSLDEFVEVKGFIVIANDEVSIVNRNPRLDVIRKSDIYAHLATHDLSLSEADITLLVSALKAAACEPKAYSMVEVEQEMMAVLLPALNFLTTLQTDCVTPFQSPSQS